MPTGAEGYQALVAQARAARAAGELTAARAALEAALRVEPDHADSWTGLAELLQTLGHEAEALAAVERALALAPRDPAALLRAALVRNAAGDAARAEAILRELLARDPFHAAARANLASLLERGNRYEEAEREAREGLRSAPHEPLLALVVAQCALHRKDLDGCETWLGRLRTALGRDPRHAAGLVPQHAAYLAAQLLQARGRHADAWDAFVAANDLARRNAARRGVDGAEYRAKLAVEAAAFTPAWVAGWQPLPEPPPLPFRPAFLVGFPRSGTTLLEQILDAHPEVIGLEEQGYLEEALSDLPGGYPQGLATLAPAGHAALRARYADAVLRRRPEAAGKVMVDKHPLKLPRAGAIQRVIPEARFILALRHPYDAVLSNVMQEFGFNSAMANMFSLEDAAALYHATMTLWERHRAQQPLAVVTVRYEALVEDLPGQVRPVLEHLGVGWDARVEGFAAHALGRGRIRTPSYSQVRQGLYTRARGRHLDYAACFTPQVRALLDPWVAHWGYQA